MTITVSECGVWLLDEIYQKINAGYMSYTIPKTDPGTLFSWGFNNYGQLGDGTAISRSSPVQIPGTTWSDISAGGTFYFTLARKSDGTLWAWGGGNYGQLGDGTNIFKSSPVQIPGTTWNDIAAGGSHSLARRTDGTLWAWGDNTYGNLGQQSFGSTEHRSSPIQIPGTIWNDVAAGKNFSFARRTDGTLWTWGYNNYGQMGISSGITASSSPVQIPGTTWNDISTSSMSTHALARKTDGGLWAWGDNTCGQLGQNNTISRSSPVVVPGTTWNDIATGVTHSLARRTDGTLWAWGDGTYGQLGLNDTVSRSSPVQISGTTWIAAAAGYHSLARRTDGTLWAWGSNSYGQLGQNDTIDRSSPVQISGTTWSDITSGYFSLARKSL